MKKLLIFASLIFMIFAVQTKAQNREAVSAAEVNGTFCMPFGGKYKGSYNEIKILALGKGKLRVAFGLVYPYTTGTGELTANVGEADGTATIEGDTAVFTMEDFEECRITIQFVKPGTIKVSQDGTDCGFGHNVNASGTYRKTNGAKPTFDQ